ncbi:MAG: hypothetical protein V4489_01275 [Chlamydiota bacterium]
MNISFSDDSFKQTKLFVATPMYGGACTSDYLKGMMDLSAACAVYNIPMIFYEITDQGLVQKARNTCVDAFLESNFTHLLFIDADIGFTARDALSLLYLMNEDKEEKYDILAGPYPKKRISWKKVKRAVEKGLANQDADFLAQYTGDFTFLAPTGKPFSSKLPSEVLKIGAGFMIIPRRTFEKFRHSYPDKSYKISETKEEYDFFTCEIDPKTRLYMPEDYLFCHRVRDMGGKVWLAPWLGLSHQGPYSFQGSLDRIAALGMNPTDG